MDPLPENMSRAEVAALWRHVFEASMTSIARNAIKKT